MLEAKMYKRIIKEIVIILFIFFLQIFSTNSLDMKKMITIKKENISCPIRLKSKFSVIFLVRFL
jgi:hypothetical protein